CFAFWPLAQTWPQWRNEPPHCVQSQRGDWSCASTANASNDAAAAAPRILLFIIPLPRAAPCGHGVYDRRGPLAGTSRSARRIAAHRDVRLGDHAAATVRTRRVGRARRRE